MIEDDLMPFRRNKFWIVPILAALLFSACVHPVRMHARDGERLDGRWRFAREGGGLMQVFSSDGEVLVGTLTAVAREKFFASYQQTFGQGSIDAEPDLSSYGHAFWSLPGRLNPLSQIVQGENFDTAAVKSTRSVMGPLFYWTGNLQGDKRTSMQCFLIGSSLDARGLGRCKGPGGKEYTVDF
jgi:hypothetical protein